MPQKQRKLLFSIVCCLFLILGIPRLFSLDAHWSSDEARWLRRSAEFMSAVKNGRFSETLVAYHPGVTTMWIAGLRTFSMDPGVDVPNLARARWFIGIVVWAGIGIACLLLYKLFGEWITLSGLACLAYSPLFLAQTRRVHTDALATTFILLTVLLFLIYCQNRERPGYLVLSGLSFGLAILSKSYAMILVAWIPLCLFLFRESQERRSNRFYLSVAEGLCFFNCTAVTVLALWPVFWTPLWGLMTLGLFGLTLIVLKGIKNRRCSRVLMMVVGAGLVLLCVRATQNVWYVFDRVNWAVATPHEVEHFFLGKVVYDPGWLFYPFVLTIKSTPLMLPLAIVGCILLWRQRKQTEAAARHFRMALVLVIGVALFIVCLSATSKKFSRYLLPAFPMLEILAAIGLVEGLKWGYTALCFRFRTEAPTKYKTAFAVIACLGFFFIQVFPVMARHPYYGTYYNLCWKVTDITRIFTVGDASGLDIAANYLNEKSDTGHLVVQVSPLSVEFVRYYFNGYAYGADTPTMPNPDYEVVYIRDSQIKMVPQEGRRGGELEHVITLNGIDLVWIYRIPRKESP